jgi:hypothetical protein
VFGYRTNTRVLLPSITMATRLVNATMSPPPLTTPEGLRAVAEIHY